MAPMAPMNPSFECAAWSCKWWPSDSTEPGPAPETSLPKRSAALSDVLRDMAIIGTWDTKGIEYLNVFNITGCILLIYIYIYICMPCIFSLFLFDMIGCMWYDVYNLGEFEPPCGSKSLKVEDSIFSFFWRRSASNMIPDSNSKTLSWLPFLCFHKFPAGPTVFADSLIPIWSLRLLLSQSANQAVRQSVA